jgi:hypothetical protein
MAQIYTINAQGQYVLPNTLPGLSDTMRSLLAGYVEGLLNFNSDDPNAVHRITERVRDFAPVTLADFAAKVMIGAHYTNPHFDAEALAIESDLRDDHVAAQILLSCVSNLLDLSGPRPDRLNEWDKALHDYRAAFAELDTATGAYGLVEYGDDQAAIDAAQARMDAASDADTEARDRMMATPVARLVDLTVKIDEATSSLRIDHIAAVNADILRFAHGDTVSPELTALVADYKRLDVAADRYLAKVPDPTNDEFDAVVDPVVEALQSVVQFPVRSIADLNLKMAVIQKEDQFRTDGTKEAIARDVQSLAGSEAVI